MNGRWARWLFVSAVAIPLDAQPAPPPAAPANDDLYQAGKQLFDQFAPPEIKAQFDFPSADQWNEFATRLQHGLETGSLDELAGHGPEARAALTALRAFPDYADTAGWLEQRLDEIDGAQEALAPTPAPTRPAPATPKTPATRPAPPRMANVPYYDLWLARVRGRAVPARSAALMPQLRKAFAAEGVPPQLVWLAEAESSFDPTARSPAGARGLFQLMPDTARGLGLATWLPDERTDPAKSAHAAARYLRTLHARFGDWPLAFAAYNTGEGRVSRALAARHGHDFASIASTLPAETRMYVPKVCALITTREGVTPEQLPAPRS